MAGLAPGVMINIYRLTERIGKGGFSEVWSAWDERLKRLVAIKLTSLDTNDAHSILQFHRETMVVTKLEHPHILPLYDFGQTDLHRYVIMRYVTGGSLVQRLHYGPLPPLDIIHYMQPIAQALDYIHEQNIVHRDLKPGNILLDAQNTPYLTDFGLAKEIGNETNPLHSVAGTLAYMPPEQFGGAALSIRSDLYSFGVMLYQLFSGKLPYDGQAALGANQLRTNEELPELEYYPSRLSQILRHLTAVQAQDRPGNADLIMREVAAMFEPVIEPAAAMTTTLKPVSISLVLESEAYRQREAEHLLKGGLEAWSKGEFSLSVTHFVLLTVLLRDLPDLVTSDVRSMMLRGAFEYHQDIEEWWNKCTDQECQRAAWHALNIQDVEVVQRVLTWANTSAWAQNIPLPLLEKLGDYLAVDRNPPPIILDFLAKVLNGPTTWQVGLIPAVIDAKLSELAVSGGKLAVPSAKLIGQTYRQPAVEALPRSLGRMQPLLTAYEEAGSLPGSIPILEQLNAMVMLGAQQLLRSPAKAFYGLIWSIVGGILAMAFLIFVMWAPSIIPNTRILNTLGQGLLYGILFGVTVWLTRHISQRLRVLPYVVRVLLGTLVGGVLAALTFTLYHQLSLDNVISFDMMLGSGVLAMVGFALSVDMPLALQVVAGMASMMIALLEPWLRYLQTFENEPPIYLLENPINSVWLVLVFALILTVVGLWQPIRTRYLSKASSTIRPPHSAASTPSQ